MRLTAKLTIGLVAAILPVIAINSGFRVRREIDESKADLHADDIMLGQALAGATENVWRSEGELAAQRFVTGANQRQQLVAVRWTWLDVPAGDRDAPLATAAALSSLAIGAPLVVRTRQTNGDSLCTYIAVMTPGSRPGAIEVQRPLAPERSFIHHTIRQAATASVAMLALCGILALGLGAVLVAKPVTRLVEQMRRIGAGDLSARLRLAQHDELGQLGSEVDIMCDRLAEARDRVDAATTAKLAALEQVRHADRLATVGKLAAGLAHELGTPLNVIAGHAQLITADHPDGSEDHEHASIVIEQTQRVASIIRKLLDFARRGAPRRSQLELGPLVRETVALLAPLAVERRIEVAIAIPDGGLVCRADHRQIQQAITNLVVNGLQAVGHDGHLVIAVSSCRATPPADPSKSEMDYARIDVTDDGSGIAPDVLPHIFEPFFTTKDVGEGTGLGLSVTYGIVRDHDGWIDVTSTPGDRTHFAIFLPLEGPTGSPTSERSSPTSQRKATS